MLKTKQGGQFGVIFLVVTVIPLFDMSSLIDQLYIAASD